MCLSSQPALGEGALGRSRPAGSSWPSPVASAASWGAGGWACLSGPLSYHPLPHRRGGSPRVRPGAPHACDFDLAPSSLLCCWGLFPTPESPEVLSGAFCTVDTAGGVLQLEKDGRLKSAQLGTLYSSKIPRDPEHSVFSFKILFWCCLSHHVGCGVGTPKDRRLLGHLLGGGVDL